MHACTCTQPVIKYWYLVQAHKPEYNFMKIYIIVEYKQYITLYMTIQIWTQVITWTEIMFNTLYKKSSKSCSKYMYLKIIIMNLKKEKIENPNM